jgi:hypothetical protein
VLTAFGVCLHRFVLIHSPSEAEGQVAGRRERFTGLGFILVDKVPDTGHIYFKQRVDAVLHQYRSRSSDSELCRGARAELKE